MFRSIGKDTARMGKRQVRSRNIALASIFSILMLGAAGCATQAVETKAETIVLSEGLFDLKNEATLGLASLEQQEHFTIFAPENATDRAYNHGVVLFGFKGRLFAQWQSSLRDEDAPETVVSYATSEDGESWSTPKVLAPERAGAVVTSGGWWSDGELLIAYINVWPELEGTQRHGWTEYAVSKDGVNWSEFLPVTDTNGEPVPGVIEQDLRALPSGRLVTTFHVQPGLVAAPHFTDDPAGLTGWTRGEMQNLPYEGDVSRELEPSWYVRPDGSLVMLFRDQGTTHKTLVSVSHDEGASWSSTGLADFPDSRSKQSAGNLPDGSVFRVNNPREDRTRYPLVISLSADGVVFDRAFLIRGQEDLPSMLFDGKYKRIGYSYPKSVVIGDYLYIAYATNKERVEYSRILLNALTKTKP